MKNVGRPHVAAWVDQEGEETPKQLIASQHHSKLCLNINVFIQLSETFYTSVYLFRRDNRLFCQRRSINSQMDFPEKYILYD